MSTKHKRGITLVEILVASLIFTIALAALVNSLLSTVYFLENSKDTTIAVSDLRNMLERIRATPFNDMLTDFPDGLGDGPPGNNYQDIVGNYSLNNEHITVTYANTGSDTLEVNVALDWQGRRGRAYSTSMSTFVVR